MTILQRLDAYYRRMAARGEAQPPGYSREKIGYALVLTPAGEPIDVLDLRQADGKKRRAPLLEVPAGPKRTSKIVSNIFWDKTSYVFGRTDLDPKLGDAEREKELARTVKEREAFKARHMDVLAGAKDEGLLALLRFVETWDPGCFDAAPFAPDMLDANFVFRLDGDTDAEGRPRYLHQRPAAREIVEAQDAQEMGPHGMCLVTGVEAPLSRLHPSIKGVRGAQEAGAALISFNLDAFESYGKTQGYNAPISAAAAFRCTAALNRLLDFGGRNRLEQSIGDATVVYWADASGAAGGEAAAALAEDLFGGWLDDAPADDKSEAAKLGDALRSFAEGRPDPALAPAPTRGVRFCVLGLSPNAARLSVRFWVEDEFTSFARRLARHARDLSIAPAPRQWGAKPPSLARLLVQTCALQGKIENTPPLLAGEIARAVLTGGRYPRAALVAAIARLRAGDDASTGWHAALIRAVLERDARFRAGRNDDDDRMEVPMALDRTNTDAAYLCGRLFATLEQAQTRALGKISATIRDRFFGAASATPAGLFPMLLRNAQNHLAALRKEGKGGDLERAIETIVAALGTKLPRSLPLESQGRFIIGYYHQRQSFFEKRAKTDAEEPAAQETVE